MSKPNYETAYFCAADAPTGSQPIVCWTCSGPATHVHHNPDARDELLEAAKQVEQTLRMAVTLSPTNRDLRALNDSCGDALRAAIAAVEGETL